MESLASVQMGPARGGIRSGGGGRGFAPWHLEAKFSAVQLPAARALGRQQRASNATPIRVHY